MIGVKFAIKKRNVRMQSLQGVTDKEPVCDKQFILSVAAGHLLILIKGKI